MRGSALLAATQSLTDFNKKLTEEGMPSVRKASLPNACRAYKELRDMYEALDEQRKAILKALEEINREVIPGIMETEGTPSLKVECHDGNHYRFVRSQRLSVSMLDKEQGMGWLREIGQEGIIQETVNAQTLSGFARTWIQDEGKEMPAELFELTTMNVVSVTKA